jgi:hypothetical protein
MPDVIVSRATWRDGINRPVEVRSVGSPVREAITRGA